MIARACFRPARRASSTDFAPVITILPELNINVVVRGSRIRMISAWNFFGLYSTFRACCESCDRGRRQSRFTVATMFWIFGHGQSAFILAIPCSFCCSCEGDVCDIVSVWLSVCLCEMSVGGFLPCSTDLGRGFAWDLTVPKTGMDHGYIPYPSPT